jgi:hypothetical protein
VTVVSFKLITVLEVHKHHPPRQAFLSSELQLVITWAITWILHANRFKEQSIIRSLMLDPAQLPIRET